MLTLTLLIPIAGILFVFLAGRVHATGARVAALITSVLSVNAAYLLAAQTRLSVIDVDKAWIPSFGVHFALRADWIAALFVLLTAILTVFAVAVSWKEVKQRVTSFHVWLLVLQVGVTLVFLSRDLMLFYLGWELMLIPMLFIIGAWGTGRKEYSAFKFVLFTFTGSIFMLAAFLYIYYQHYTQHGVLTFHFDQLANTALSATQKSWLFLGLLVGFAVKVPLVPLHTWLIDAYPNSPTAGSLLLSGILSKTGIYGLFRIAEGFGQEVFLDFRPLLIILAIIGIFYGGWIAYHQSDIKRLIAYSSLSHVNFILLGIFISSDLGFKGGILQMVTHGLATAALFLIAGSVQNRIGSREFANLGGLWKQAPILGAFLLFFAFASLGLPGTGNFVGELYIIGAALEYHWIAGGLASLAVLLAAIYSLRLFTGIMHGPQPATVTEFPDADRRETLLLSTLAACLIVLGFFPGLITAPLPTKGPLPEPIVMTEDNISNPPLLLTMTNSQPSGFTTQKGDLR